MLAFEISLHFIKNNLKMIVGVGVDILDSRRIARLFDKFPDRFVRKIFTSKERDFLEKRRLDVAAMAKMFAMKEAVIKAVSDVSGIFWHDIEIGHDDNGKPFVELGNVALKKAVKRAASREFKFEVSVSDESPYVCAFVVFEAA